MMDIKHGTTVQPAELLFKSVSERGLVLDAQDHQPMVVQDSGALRPEFFELPNQDKK